jgi:hypothetical protein
MSIKGPVVPAHAVISYKFHSLNMSLLNQWAKQICPDEISYRCFKIGVPVMRLHIKLNGAYVSPLQPPDKIPWVEVFSAIIDPGRDQI